VRRREFITLAGGAAAAWPLAARAQQPGKVWRMGFIAHGHEEFYDALFDGLRELGYEEGRNLIVERRYAHGRAERFQEFAAEMVRLNVDIIIVVTTPAALAVKKATTTIPIVHPNAIDPLNTGLIASLAHPGGNLTGGAQLTAEVSAKRLEILKRVVPGLSRAAALWNPGNPALAFSWKETQGAARVLRSAAKVAAPTVGGTAQGHSRLCLARACTHKSAFCRCSRCQNLPYAPQQAIRMRVDYSITSSARASSVGGTVRPSALAVLRLMTSSNLVGCITGRSLGLAPLRMRPT
jgi:hypothetical protein